MGLGAYAGRLDNFDVQRALVQLDALWAEAPQLLPKVAAQARAYRHALEAQYDSVFGRKPAA